MRKRPCLQNLGAFTEAVFVCASTEAEFFGEVAEYMTYEYGVCTEVFVYDDPAKKSKKVLRTAYNVIFVSDSKTLIEASAADGKDHPFRRIFSYVRCFNPFSISYATVEKKSLPELKNVVFPKSMRVLHNLHRKYIDTNDAFSVARNVSIELRRNIPTKERRMMRGIAKDGLDVYQDFYANEKHNENFLYAAVALLICVLHIVLPLILEDANMFVIIMLGLVYALACYVAPVFGFYFVAKHNSDLYHSKKLMLDHLSNDDDFDYDEDKNRAKSAAFMRSMVISIVLYLVFVFISGVLESQLLTSVFYGAFAVYYLLYGVWVLQNRKWLSQSEFYIQYAIKRQKYLVFVKYPKLWLKKLPLILITAFVIFYIICVLLLIFGVI